MIFNPTKLSWTAPTEREDGSPITGDLTYSLWIDGVESQSLPGSLNPEGKYEAALTISEPGQYSLYLTATETYPDGKALTSQPSNAVEIEVTAAPLAPAALAAE